MTSITFGTKMTYGIDYTKKPIQVDRAIADFIDVYTSENGCRTQSEVVLALIVKALRFAKEAQQ